MNPWENDPYELPIVADPLREFADAISKHAGYGVTMPNPLSVHSGAPVGPTSETEDLYALADQIDTEHERLEQENAKLREQLADVIESMGRVDERCAKLRVERDEWHRVAESKQDIIDHMRDANAENARLRELVRRLLTEYRYMRVRPRRVYLEHEKRMREIEDTMHELGIEVE